MFDKIKELKRQISKLQRTLRTYEKLYKEELLKKEDVVEGLTEYIIQKEYPTDLFNEYGIDSGQFDRFGDIKIKIVYDHGYTDVVGLTDEQFKQLCNNINKYYYEQLRRGEFMED